MINDSSATEKPVSPVSDTAGERFIAYITKYALTAGIFAIWAKEVGNGMIKQIQDRDVYPTYYHGKGKDWHRTMDSAINKAEQMRDAKIKSLDKSIQKMRALDFRSPAVTPAEEGSPDRRG